jgi:hypothetical protein
VTSISRSGEPQWSTVTSSPEAPAWSRSVKWQKADILKPTTYKPYLKDADAVVHTMGILLEADYKGVISGKESIWGGLSRAFSATKGGSAKNPLEMGEGEELKPGEKDGQLTYELMNRDSGIYCSHKQTMALDKSLLIIFVAITLAKESLAEKVPTFVFISAAAGTPILPKRYITTKRDAEAAISTLPNLRSIFIRPGFLYDSSRTFTMPIAFFGGVGYMANSVVGGRLTWLAGAAVEKPLKADLVAEAVVEAIGNDEAKGVVNTEQIEALANKAWRRGML